MDFFFLFAKIFGAFIFAFHLTLFVMNRDTSDLLSAVCVVVASPAVLATEKIRGTKWHTALGIATTWVSGFGVTFGMTKNEGDITYDPTILPWVVLIFSLMNCTLHWYGGAISFVCQLAINISACFFTYGNTESF